MASSAAVSQRSWSSCGCLATNHPARRSRQATTRSLGASGSPASRRACNERPVSSLPCIMAAAGAPFPAPSRQRTQSLPRVACLLSFLCTLAYAFSHTYVYGLISFDTAVLLRWYNGPDTKLPHAATDPGESVGTHGCVDIPLPDM